MCYWNKIINLIDWLIERFESIIPSLFNQLCPAKAGKKRNLKLKITSLMLSVSMFVLSAPLHENIPRGGRHFGLVCTYRSNHRPTTQSVNCTNIPQIGLMQVSSRNTTLAYLNLFTLYLFRLIKIILLCELFLANLVFHHRYLTTGGEWTVVQLKVAEGRTRTFEVQ